MGGLGSGRRPERLATCDCRTLEIGELCDAGRWQAQPQGQVLWRGQRDGLLRGRLTYEFSGDEDPLGEELTLTCRYWPVGAGFSREEEIELDSEPGKRTYALCPACGARVRSLYAPPGASSLRCRSCCGLLYRRRRGDAAELERVRKAAGPAIRALLALPQRTRRKGRRRYVPRPPAQLARELAAEIPLADQETRLWCLRLRAAGLSYRQIAALTESSKSQVARICRTGRRAIDTQALVRERLERDSRLPPFPEGDDGPGLRAQLAALRHHDLRLGLYEQAAREPEERVVLPADEPFRP